jgi:hypothetical protein
MSKPTVVPEHYTNIIERRNHDKRRLLQNEVRTMLDLLDEQQCEKVLDAKGFDAEAKRRALVAISRIYFHIEQFDIFWSTVDRYLERGFIARFLATRPEQDELELLEGLPPDEQEQIRHTLEFFREQVVDFLAMIWSVLRNMAFQRLPGGPYLLSRPGVRYAISDLEMYTELWFKRLLTGLKRLDDDLAEGRVAGRRKLQQDESRRTGFVEVLKNSYPILYLGGSAKVQFIGDFPPILSLPLDALYVDEEQLSSTTSRTKLASEMPEREFKQDDQAMFVGHELGHIVLQRVPGLFEDIQAEVSRKIEELTGSPADSTTLLRSRQRKILLDLMLAWLEEIIADLFGATLLGPVFIKEALELGVAPDVPLAGASQSHPPSVIRPWLMLHLFEHLRKQYGSWEGADWQDAALTEELERVRAQVEQRTQAALDRRFDIPRTVTIIRQREVRDLAYEFVDLILKARPPLLKGAPLSQLLFSCSPMYRNYCESPEVEEFAFPGFPNWGIKLLEESASGDLVLSLNERNGSGNPIVDFLNILFGGVLIPSLEPLPDEVLRR